MIRTRQWAPSFVLGCVILASWVGYDERTHQPSWTYALVGLVFGLTFVAVVALTGRR